jgi:hypothetical protein
MARRIVFRRQVMMFQHPACVLDGTPDTQPRDLRSLAIEIYIYTVLTCRDGRLFDTDNEQLIISIPCILSLAA